MRGSLSRLAAAMALLAGAAAAPVTGEAVAMGDLEQGVRTLLKQWGSDTYLPNYMMAGGRYLSMADTFSLVAQALAERHRTGRRPESVRVVEVNGPLETPDEHGPAQGTVAAVEVNRLAAKFAEGLRDGPWKALPDNRIPSWVEAGGMRMTGGQFLRLMCESLVAETPLEKLAVKMTNPLSAAGLVYPKMRSSLEQGGS